MPRIREYTPRETVQGEIQTRYASAGQFGSGDDLLLASAAISKVGEGLFETAERQEVSDIDAKLAKTRADWTLRLNERANAATPGDMTFASSFNNESAAELGKIEETIKTAGGKRAFQRLSARLAADFVEKAGLAQSQMAGEKARQDALKASDSYRNALLNDPTQFDAISNDMNASFNDPASMYSLLPVNKREELRTTVQKSLALSAVQGFISRNPDFARSQLTEGLWDKYLDADHKAALIKSAEAAIDKSETATDARLESQRQIALSDLSIALYRGEKSYGDIEAAFQAGILTPKERSAAVYFLDNQRSAEAFNAQELARVSAAMDKSGPPLDHKESADKKAVDLHFSTLFAPNLDKVPATELMPRFADYVSRTGIVPKELQRIVRGGLRTGDEQQVAMATELMTRMNNSNPQLLNDFDEEDIRLGRLIEAYTAVGLTYSRASTLAREALAVPKSVRADRADEFKSIWSKSKSESAMIKEFHSIWPGDVDFPAAMRFEFENVIQAEYGRTGNIEASTKLALDSVRRQWGVTRVGDKKRYMKHAPETVYGVPNFTDRENAEWMNRQLVKDVTEGAFMSPDQPIKAERLSITADPKSVAGDGLPVYQVHITGADGILYTMMTPDNTPLLWRPNWNLAKDIELKSLREERQRTQEGQGRELPPWRRELRPAEQRAIEREKLRELRRKSD